ncbi:MAG: hypothetical protein ABL891_16175 [Burkholderiales bacterium]
MRMRMAYLARAEGERRVAVVPRWVLALFVAALAAYAALRATEPKPVAVASALEAPWPASVLRALSLGEPQAMSQFLALYLQAFDNQPGVSVPFRALDYARVMEWLGTALALDSAAQYPLMMASQLYGLVSEAPDKQRAMCDFVHREFLVRPDARWRWLAHCAIMAKHRLKDPPLALRYAEDIARHAGRASNWARQMRIFILEDMGETERAAVLLGGLLAGKEITDDKEIHFLTERLEKLKRVEKSASPSKNRQ